MTGLMAKPGTMRLLAGAVVLFSIVILLQLGILLQRHLGQPAASSPTPDVRAVWSQADEIESMHAHINRLFDQAFRAPLSVPPPPAAQSNAPLDSGSAASFEDTFAHMRRMQRQINAMFARAQDEPVSGNASFDEGWARLQVTPGFNIQDNDTFYEVMVHLPGVDKSAIQITVSGAVLSIAARQEFRQAGESSPGAARQIRRASQRFERHLRLPGATADEGKIRAAFTNDVLMIIIPKEDPPDLDPRPVQIH